MQQLTRSMPTRWALVLLIFTACLVPASVTSATPPGTGGRIAFMRHDDEGHWQIWTANPDMTAVDQITDCLLYTSPSPRDRTRSRMPSSA